MATVTCAVHITTAWWLPLYLRTLTLICLAMGTEPDMAKVEQVVKRAIRTKLLTTPVTA
jgi:hypothetical protein